MHQQQQGNSAWDGQPKISTSSSCTSRLRLFSLLCGHISLALLLLLLGFLICFPLETGLLRVGLLQRREEALESALFFRRRHLDQFPCRGPDSVFTESFLDDQELHQAIHIGRFPLKVALLVLSRVDIRMEEELSSSFIWPVLGNGVFGVFEGLYHPVKSTMIANEFQCCLRSDAFDGVDIVATQEDAKIEKLSWCHQYDRLQNQDNTRYLWHFHTKTSERFVEMYFLNRLLTLLTERQMS
jgi:hypothetical protein